MASGRIQPGSRQWVEAMRRLSGTEDTTVDMSMGRKVSRDAAIPHGMGTAALDTRLRGGGGDGVPEYDARDPANLPVGPSWLRFLGYTRPAGETRQGPILEFLDGAPGQARWSFRFDGGQSQGSWGGPTGAETVLLTQSTGEDIAIVSDGAGQVLARFLMDIPAGMAEGERRPPPLEPFEFDRGSIFRFIGSRNGSVTFTGGRTPLTTDAPADWNMRISAGARSVTWDNFTMPVDRPLFLTITDADGFSHKVTFDYTGLVVDNEQRPVTLVSLSDQVRDIIGQSMGFAFDPFDFSTILTTGSVPVSAIGQPIIRINSKWGGFPVAFTGGGAQSLAAEQGINFVVATAANNTWNGDLAVREFFRNRASIFICQAMQPAARPPARAHTIAASQVSGAMGRLTLHTDNDLSVTLNYRRTDLGDGAGKVEMPADTLKVGRRTVVSCEVDFIGGGARIWADGVPGEPSIIPAPSGVGLEDTLPQRVRLSQFTAGGVNMFWGGGLGRAVYLPFIPSADQREVIEAWVAEPPEVQMATFPDPSLDARMAAILRVTKGFALDPQDLTLMWQDDEATIPVTAPGQPVGAIRSKFGNQVYTYRSAESPGTVYAGDGAISHDGLESGLFSPDDNASTGNTGMTVVARFALAPTQKDETSILNWTTDAGGDSRLALMVGSDLKPTFQVRRPDTGGVQIDGEDPMAAGVPLTIAVRASFMAVPALVEGFVDGVLVGEDELPGAPLGTDAGRSNYAGYGAFDPGGALFSGYMGRMVFAHFVQTDKDMAAFREWVEAGAWPTSPPVDPPPPIIDPPADED